ncbi:AAA family ATPase [Arcobacter sp. FWKO B]|uniref:AAA family ATPase n=1 Tax=Arcobacter sp. FWKO B TaxID=2593672 RepID=UPI0019048D09|nr:AAA family ATPase [Arcobacter sp. FWKO B]
MLPNSDNNNKKNFKLMVVSSSILLALFIYTIFKSSATIEGSSYYIGMVFLFALMLLAFGLHFFREKIRAMLPVKQNFSQTLEDVQNESATISAKTSQPSTIEVTKSNIRFSDIAGIQNTKSELNEIVDFLNNPKKYLKYGVKLPKGVLLVGPPGVGKTLIARAVAGEANVPFFYQSGASFVHIYVGMGAKRVRELFAKAKSVAPAIVFIDEIDAIGKKRTGDRNDEREATLNELLTCMDGFEGDSSVVVIAATNKIEVLDEALLRAGRFDRRVFLNLPSTNDRIEILKLYLKGKQYSFDINSLANETLGFSSSALATLVNEALLNMIKRGGVSILDEDISAAKIKLEYGTNEKKFYTPEEIDILALYKAIQKYFLKYKQQGSKSILSKSEMISSMKYYLSGSVGIEYFKKEPYTLNSNDIKEAYNIADIMKNQYKMVDDVTELVKIAKMELKDEISQFEDEILEIKKTLEVNGEIF